MNYDNTTRDSTVTFRGGRSLRPVLDPGKIGSDATCPGLVTINSIEDAKGDDNLSYVWYVKRPENTFFELIEGEHGAELVNYDFVSVGRASTVAYTFRRKATTLTDEVYVDFTLTLPNMLWQVSTSALIVNACGDSEGVIATSIISSANYEWKYNGRVLSNTSIYQPSRSDFGGNIGLYDVECIISRGNCSDTKLIIIQIAPPAIQTFRVCGDNMLDCEGNAYSTVLIGSQCWMGENLAYSGRGICWGNDCENYGDRGRMYLWTEAMRGQTASNTIPSGVQGICPDGWHIPGKAEALVMMDYLKGQYNVTDVRPLLADDWPTGNFQNITGFTWRSYGYWRGGFTGGTDTRFWLSSTVDGSNYDMMHKSYNPCFEADGSCQGDRNYLRCVKD